MANLVNQITDALDLAKNVGDELNPGQVHSLSSSPLSASSATASVQHCHSYLAIGYDQAGINCIRYNNNFIQLPESFAPSEIAKAIISPEIGQDNFADSYLIIGYSESYEIDCVLVRNSTNTFTQIGHDDPVKNINAHFAQQNELREEANRGSVDFTPIESNNTQILEASVMTSDNEPEQMPLSNTQNLLDAAANLMANLRLPVPTQTPESVLIMRNLEIDKNLQSELVKIKEYLDNDKYNNSSIHDLVKNAYNILTNYTNVNELKQIKEEVSTSLNLFDTTDEYEISILNFCERNLILLENIITHGAKTNTITMRT